MLNNKLIVGLTGGIGSGKTVATDWFAEQGIDIVDADVIAHTIVAKATPTLAAIHDAFGDWVINEVGELNRPALREHVFTNPEALIQLESITHPAIRKEIENQLSKSTSDYIILSAPLLLESGQEELPNLCQRILVIDTPEEIQLARASQRDGQTIEKIKKVMANQLSRAKRNAQADDIVINNGSVENLHNLLIPLHQKYLLMSQQ